MPMKKYESVQEYIDDLEHWKSEIQKLRSIVNSTELVETIKWSAPCYTIDGKNVVGLAAFKDYFGMWFHQGVFLSDPEEVLINRQEGKTKGLRQWRFQTSKEIKVRLIKTYLQEAILLTRQGKEIKPARNKSVTMPKELTEALKAKRAARQAFEKLTPGRQREYADFITEAKRAETKTKRLDKILPLIQNGIGLNDKYRSQ